MKQDKKAENAVQGRKKIDALLNADVHAMDDASLQDGQAALSAEAERLLTKLKKIRKEQAANEDQNSLQDDLERRYGGPFAQWVADRLHGQTVTGRG
jgi:hypothetical protein